MTPGQRTTDPREAMDAGNSFRAIELLEARLRSGRGGSAQVREDRQLLALARYRSEDWAGAAADFRQLIADHPGHAHQEHWQRFADQAENTLRTGEGAWRDNPLNASLTDPGREQPLSAAPRFYYPEGRWRDEAAVGALGGVFGFLESNVATLMNGGDYFFGEQEWYQEWQRGGQFDHVSPLYGVRVLSNQRDRLFEMRTVPDDAEPAPITNPNHSQGGFSDDGRQIDPDYANSGGIGEGTPIHGAGGADEQTGFEHLLPSPAVVAQTFLYREDGQAITAPHLNALVADHLFELPHDVKQTLFDDNRRQAIAVAPNSFEDALGLSNDFVPANQVNAAGGHLTASTGQWDGDQWYGRYTGEVLAMRTDPNTGDLMPNGQIYLEEGRWIPEREVDGMRVLGLPVDSNRTLGSIAVATVYLREHNRRAEVFARRYPQLNGEEIYWLARRSVVGSYAKEHTASWTPSTFGQESIVAGLHSNSHGFLESRKPLHEMQLWRPNQGEDIIMSGLMANREVSEQFDVPDWKGEDFAGAYTAPGHTMQPVGYDPSLFDLTGESSNDQETIPLERTLGVAGNDILKERGLGAVLHALMQTPLGLPTLHNHPDFMRGMPSNGGPTSLAEMDVQRRRERGVGNYVNLYTRLGLPAPTRYEDVFDATTEHGRWVIERHHELYGEYNEATGGIYIDDVVGQLGDRNRPTNTVVPNTTFQVFLAEASARLMMNPGLSAGLHPEHLSMVGTNMVQEDWFGDLMYRHGGADNPEFREFMRQRPRPLIYSNMGNPDAAHPTEEFVDYVTGENMYGDGTGLPYLPKHFTGEGLENNNVVRVVVEGRAYIVDATDERVWVDHDDDGVIHMRDGIFEPLAGPSTDELLAAVRGSGSDFYEVGEALTEREIRRLIQYEYDDRGVGIRVSR